MGDCGDSQERSRGWRQGGARPGALLSVLLIGFPVLLRGSSTATAWRELPPAGACLPQLDGRRSCTVTTGVLIGLRGGGKKQKRNARGTRHVLEELARTSLHSSAVGPKKGHGPEGAGPYARIVRTGMMGHLFDPEGVPGAAGIARSGAASYGRAAGEAARQKLQQQHAGTQVWQHTRAPMRKRHRVVVDGSNVLKHGGGKAQVGNMVGLIAAVEQYLKVSQSDILVIVDHWVAKEMGQAGLAQLRSGDYTLRIARDHVSADVRIQQAAKELRAIVVTSADFHSDTMATRQQHHQHNFGTVSN